ncbi:MAG: M48 family metallopeptidase [Clostridia bacterium]|nr:M48 family metallopeptidase [Clostridia bacterium]
MEPGFDYTVIRSKRRSFSLEVTRDGTVKVRVPMRTKEKEIASFVEKHSDWVLTKLKEASQRRDIFSSEDDREIASLINAAKEYIPRRVEYWSAVMGLTHTGIRITRARTRYGSCSPKNSLNFSCFIMRLTPEEIDYVIVHELAHIREKNHGRNFYAVIERFLPNYKELQKSLKK